MHERKLGIISDFLAYAREKNYVFAECDLRVVLDETLTLLENRSVETGHAPSLSHEAREASPIRVLRHFEADRAPAGPGVLLLTDSDLTTYYYVEPCDTLRIAVANLFRGSSRRGATPIKPQLAEHLGIAETRVSKYLADHCVVRYLQLDDDARYFAHFVIAVLRPALNE